MAKLGSYISSEYISAANSLKGKAARRRIVAYVESYDDVLFWRMILNEFENEKQYFEVMLPTRDTLNKGKRQALLSLMKNGGGENLIACVDADYDYLLQGASYQSDFMLHNPYVVHTFAYAIENLQCYAPSLHNVCVMATLNDHEIFDFKEFLATYSKAVFPLFVWSIMLYKRREYAQFTITDFNNIVGLKHTRLQEVPMALEKVRRKVNAKIGELRKRFPNRKEEYLQTKASIMELGVTPETTYLYIQGHHLFDSVVVPTMQTVCDLLRSEREREIKRKALHSTQMHNELAAYLHSQCDIKVMLRKNFNYTSAAPYNKIKERLTNLLCHLSEEKEGMSNK